MSPNRTPLYPNVPSIAELGYKGIELDGWFGLFGPAKIPEPTLQLLNRTLKKIINEPSFIARMTDLGAEIPTDANTPSVVAKTIEKQSIDIHLENTEIALHGSGPWNGNELEDFFTLCEKHVTLNGNKFSYTLSTKDDWEQATKNVQANKLISPSTAVTQSTPTVITPVSIDNKVADTSLTKPDSPLDSETNNLVNLPTDTQPIDTTKVKTDTTKDNITKPSFFESILDVISFQIWANKNKSTLNLNFLKNLLLHIYKLFQK